MNAGPSGPSEQKGQPGLVSAALSGLCPRCGAKTLFAAPAALADECSACGLDILALERGANGRVFDNATVAERWLRHGGS